MKCHLDQSTKHAAINIVTVLGHCDKRYPGIVQWYSDLSERAHPNCEGICVGYAKADRENYVTTFSNRWAKLYGGTHLDGNRVVLRDEVVETLRQQGDLGSVFSLD